MHSQLLVKNASTAFAFRKQDIMQCRHYARFEHNRVCSLPRIALYIGLLYQFNMLNMLNIFLKNFILFLTKHDCRSFNGLKVSGKHVEHLLSVPAE